MLALCRHKRSAYHALKYAGIFDGGLLLGLEYSYLYTSQKTLKDVT